MRTKQFKAESKKLLDMMIHSIYSNKEIFLRELISNASDALDKLYYRSLTDDTVGIDRADFAIDLAVDTEARTLTVRDNGCGMTAEELEHNLGTIAKSGSLAFKEGAEKKEDVDIIGQFGVGFYSAFMVADLVTVESKAFGAEEANRWQSKGAEGYTIEPCDMEQAGTIITLHIKEDTEEEKFGEFLDKYRIRAIVKKYSDYVHYPIRMEIETSKKKEDSDEYETVSELQTLNSMVPIWRKNKSELTDEELNRFYQEKFIDFQDPALTIHTKTEGAVTYNALLYIPGHMPYDYYTKEFEKGLQLYSSGVMIMDKCADLLPDYFSFVKGLVDSEDLSLNISREMLQQDHVVKAIAKSIEKKIKSELEKLLKNDRAKYETFFGNFGRQLKYGAYADYGMHKETLQDLLLFYSSAEKKPVTLKEYRERMGEEQKAIYYACGETVEKIDLLPQAELLKDKGLEVLYLTEDVDEFCLKMLREYDGKEFSNICADALDLDTEEEKKALESENEAAKDLFDAMKTAIGDGVQGVRFTNKLKNHPVCLTSEGEISLEMEKTLNAMPTDQKVKAQVMLDINKNHPIAQKLKTLQRENPDKVADYAKILYAQARLIGGMSVENPLELSTLICDLMV